MNRESLRGLVHGHGLLMLLCCLVPIAGVLAALVFRVKIDNLGFLAMIVLCPLLHILMMAGMKHGEHNLGQSQNAGSLAKVQADHGDRLVLPETAGGTEGVDTKSQPTVQV